VLRFSDDYMYNYLDLLEEGKLKQMNIREWVTMLLYYTMY
jgi:hypothetical protein